MSPVLQKLIAQLRLRNPRLGATRLHTALEALHADGKLREPVPSIRAIGRFLAKLQALPVEERARYQTVQWPQSFGGPDLPWESAGAIGELARQMKGMPELPLAVWFWRVTLAVPTARSKDRWRAAANLALDEGNPEKQSAIGHQILMGDIEEIPKVGLPGTTVEEMLASLQLVSGVRRRKALEDQALRQAEAIMAAMKAAQAGEPN